MEEFLETEMKKSAEPHAFTEMKKQDIAVYCKVKKALVYDSKKRDDAKAV